MVLKHWLAALLGCLVIVGPCLAGEVTIGDRTLVVADGYEVQRVAAPPLVERPISIAMDEAGRLYVTDSAGMSDKADVQAKTKPHRIRRLEDTDGDGVFDKCIVYAEGLMFPEGCMWYRGSIYVAAPPQILKLTDADGDGVAEKREVWFDGKTLTGCANDLHGPYLGRDGWFYWTKGAFAEQTYTLPNGKPFVTRASHVFRATPDGLNIEPVMTGGMDNPVGVAFLSNGERIVSGTFFQHPAGGKRDGLLHAVYGGVYGKDHAVLDGHVRTGSLMPIMTHMGAAAPAGLIAGSAGLFGGGHEDNLLACYFNLRKVVLHRLTASGATYVTQEQDLLSCEHPDFHPTDVFEDADGSLLIVDTGGWYKVCCPTSVLARPDVLGAIYRVRKKGQPKVDDPLGLKLPWAKMSPKELANLLGDKRLFVRRRAQDLLRQSGGLAAVAAVEKKLNREEWESTQLEAVWTLAGIDNVLARGAGRSALSSPSERVVHVAAHVTALYRDLRAEKAMFDLLTRPADRLSPGVLRACVEASGRIATKELGNRILDQIQRLKLGEVDRSGSPFDTGMRMLEHSIIYALIECNMRPPDLSGIDPVQCRTALVVREGMGHLTQREHRIAPLLASEFEPVRLTAAWVYERHPEWGEEAKEVLRTEFTAATRDHRRLDRACSMLVRLGKLPVVQAATARIFDDSADPVVRRTMLQAVIDANLQSPAEHWLEAIVIALRNAEGEDRALLLAAARAIPKPKSGHKPLTEILTTLATTPTLPTDVRLDALLAIGPGQPLSDALLTDVLKLTAAGEAAAIRQSAVSVVASAKLSKEQMPLLADALATAGPMELPKLLALLEKAEPREELGQRVLKALRQSPGAKSLRPEQIKPLIARYPQSIRDAAADLADRPSATAADDAAHLGKLLASLPPGDINRGQAVFVGKKASCVSCHATGYLGGKLGPDLTGIGKIRTDRDLLEAIVRPSFGFVRGYEPVVVETKDGEKHIGIITTETREAIQLAVGPQETRRIARDQVADQRPGQLSLMPEGMEAILSKQDLADLLAFLRGAKK